LELRPDLQWEGIDDVTTSIQYSNDLKTWHSEGVSLDSAGGDFTGRVTGEAGAVEELFVRVSWAL